MKSFITKILSKVLKHFLEYLLIHIWMALQTFQIIIMWTDESKLELFERQKSNNIWCKGNKTFNLPLLLEPWLSLSFLEMNVILSVFNYEAKLVGFYSSTMISVSFHMHSTGPENWHEPLLMQKLWFTKTNLTGKCAPFYVNCDTCVWTRKIGNTDGEVGNLWHTLSSF